MKCPRASGAGTGHYLTESGEAAGIRAPERRPRCPECNTEYFQEPDSWGKNVIQRGTVDEQAEGGRNALGGTPDRGRVAACPCP